MANTRELSQLASVISVADETRNIGIGTTTPTSKLWVDGDGYFTGILTANRIFSSQYGEFVGGSISGTALVGTALSISGISTLGVTSTTNLTSQQLNVSGITTVGFITATNLNVSGVGTFLSSGLKIRNPANTFNYTITGGAIAGDRTLNLPVTTITDTLAVLSTSQTFSASQTFNGDTTMNGGVTLTASTKSIGATALTVGTLTLGGASQTGSIVLGQSTLSQTTNIQAGASGVGTTKTINFGTGGASGSFTNINIGPTAGVGTIVINSGANVGIGTTNPTANLQVGIGTAGRAPLKLTAGTNLSTAQAGAIEYDGRVFYATPSATSGRSLSPSSLIYRLNSNVTGNTGISTQNSLGVSLTVPGSTVYLFEFYVAYQKTAGTTLHNFTFALGGTATFNNALWLSTVPAFGGGGVTFTFAFTLWPGTFSYTSLNTASLTLSQSGKGTVSIANGGTLNLTYTLSANPGGAYSTLAGSYLMLTPIGVSDTNTSIGAWA